jgi:hypothetical protein
MQYKFIRPGHVACMLRREFTHRTALETASLLVGREAEGGTNGAVIARPPLPPSKPRAGTLLWRQPSSNVIEPYASEQA